METLGRKEEENVSSVDNAGQRGCFLAFPGFTKALEEVITVQLPSLQGASGASVIGSS